MFSDTLRGKKKISLYNIIKFNLGQGNAALPLNYFFIREYKSQWILRPEITLISHYSGFPLSHFLHMPGMREQGLVSSIPMSTIFFTINHQISPTMKSKNPKILKLVPWFGWLIIRSIIHL